MINSYTFLKTIQSYKMLERGDKVVVAVSGGADSLALLHLLSSLAEDYVLLLHVVHVNHCLRGAESDADAEFVQDLAESMNLNCDVFRCDIAEEAIQLGLTQEEAGRKLRYAAFEDVCKKIGGNKIAVAHNLNDTVETILMRFLRGTGSKGLCGIPAVRGKIIRPLLEVSRQDIEEYCRKNGLAFRTDSTNFETIYTRNKIRLDLIPQLQKEYNPNIVEALGRLSGIISEENEYLEVVASEGFERIVSWSGNDSLGVDIDGLHETHPAIKKRIIRKALANFNIELHDLTAGHYEALGALLSKQSGKELHLPNGILARRSFSKLLICKDTNTDFHKNFCYEISIGNTVFIKETGKYVKISRENEIIFDNKFSRNVCTKAFNYDRMKGIFHVRNRRAGDKIFIASIGGNKKVKDYFIDIKLDKNQRDKIALLACDSDILLIFDEKNIMSDSYKASEDDEKAYVSIWE